jgi:hypothetical protein
MRKKIILLSALGIALTSWGCGSGIEPGFDAGNRLTVQTITDAKGLSVPIFNALEKTDDSGTDGVLNPEAPDPDGTEGNGLPDPGETVLVPLSDDLGNMTLANETRLGVKPGVALHIQEIDVTYLDANGQSHTFAPTVRYQVTGVIEPDTSADFGFILVPLSMKTAVGGLRDIFLFGTDAEIEAARKWTAIVDVYGKDTVNDDSVHAQGQISIRFINPMVEEAAGGSGT